MYDVIVVGARCAGSPLAMLLANIQWLLRGLPAASSAKAGSHLRCAFGVQPEGLLSASLSAP